MANFDLTSRVQVGGAQNGGNSRMMDVIDGSVLPYAWVPELEFEHTLRWQDLRDAADTLQEDEATVDSTIVAGEYSLAFVNARTGATLTTLTTTVHEDTVTFGGTIDDGIYDTVFDALSPPVRCRVVRSTTPADETAMGDALVAEIEDHIVTDLAGIVASASNTSGVVTIVYEAGIDPQTLTCTTTASTGTITASIASDEDAIAAALEALIEAARGADEALEDYVDDETVTAAAITITYLAGVQMRVTATVPETAGIAIVIDNTATIPMGTAGNWFPASVMVDGAIGRVVTAFDGVTTMTMTVGDAGAVDGLMTASDLLTAATVETIAATEFAEHYEATFQPLITVAADGLFADITAGQAEVMVRYQPMLTVE